MSNSESNSTSPVLLLARWSITTTYAEKQAYRDSKSYPDTARTKVEAICVRNEQHALASTRRTPLGRIIPGALSSTIRPDALERMKDQARRDREFDAWLASLSGKTPAQMQRELTAPDRGIE